MELKDQKFKIKIVNTKKKCSSQKKAPNFEIWGKYPVSLFFEFGMFYILFGNSGILTPY